MIGSPRSHLRVTDSTNARARALAATGAPHGTLVTADKQAAGRGRQGRRWEAPPGRALLASLLLRDVDAHEALLPLVAAVAVAEACEVAAGVPCLVKWPNDVWAARSERKLAGILVEARPAERWAIVGIGVNVGQTAAELPVPEATSLWIERERCPPGDADRAPPLEAGHPSPGEAGPPVAPERGPSVQAVREAGEPPSVQSVLAAVLAALDARLADDRPGTLARLRARDALLGRTVTWDGGQGTVAGIDGSGALLVDGPEGRRALRSGEVRLAIPKRFSHVRSV